MIYTHFWSETSSLGKCYEWGKSIKPERSLAGGLSWHLHCWQSSDKSNRWAADLFYFYQTVQQEKPFSVISCWFRKAKQANAATLAGHYHTAKRLSKPPSKMARLNSPYSAHGCTFYKQPFIRCEASVTETTLSWAKPEHRSVNKWPHHNKLAPQHPTNNARASQRVSPACF